MFSQPSRGTAPLPTPGSWAPRLRRCETNVSAAEGSQLMGLDCGSPSKLTQHQGKIGRPLGLKSRPGAGKEGIRAAVG